MSPRKPSWPPLPSSVAGILGPVPVTLVDELVGDDGVPFGGLWNSEDRTIQIAASQSPVNEWHAFWHEWTHTVLDDLGLGNVLGRDMEERVCDAIALARTGEMAMQLWLKAPKRPKRKRAA